MMRPIRCALVLLFVVVPVFAGTVYRFENKTEGVAQVTLAGTAEFDGSKMRMQMTQGENIIFKSGAIVISTDGGKTLNVLDPNAHTYFIIAFEDVANSLGLLSMMQISNPTAKLTDAGGGGTIEGYATQKTLVDVGFDLSIAGGDPMHVAMHTDLWTTDKVSSDNINFLQLKGFHTGLPAVDKIIDTQAAAVRGRFPLKSVMTMSIKGGALDMTAKSTATVSDIKTKNVPASDFVIPADYVKTESPMEAMKKMSGQ